MKTSSSKLSLNPDLYETPNGERANKTVKALLEEVGANRHDKAGLRALASTISKDIKRFLHRWDRENGYFIPSNDEDNGSPFRNIFHSIGVLIRELNDSRGSKRILDSLNGTITSYLRVRELTDQREIEYTKGYLSAYPRNGAPDYRENYRLHRSSFAKFVSKTTERVSEILSVMGDLQVTPGVKKLA